MFSKKFYDYQIEKSLKNAPLLNLADFPRIVLFSDCHRGDGTWNDSFLNNKPIYEAALGYYLQRDFTYIELGDGDELWENRSMDHILEIHQDVFEILQTFHRNGKFFWLWGNHDHEKSCSKWKITSSLLPPPFETMILQNPSSQENYYLLHGHQVDPLNNQLWKLARWLVRYLWKPLELCGVKDPTSSAKNYKKSNQVELRLKDWALEHQTTLIAGHTHRPTLTQPKGYWNAGSCVHPNSITCIELVDGNAQLVKWSICADENRHLKVCRYVIG